MSDAVQRGPLVSGDASNRFLHDCGGMHSPTLLCESSEFAEPKRIPFLTPFLLIGRSSRCHLSSTHPDVSYRHAYFQLVGRRVLCVDLDSRTGIRWGPDRKRAGWLEPHRPITIGPYTFRLAAEPPAPPCPDAISPDDGNPAGKDGISDCEFRLRFLNGLSESIGQADYQFFRPVTLAGRSKFCNIRLHDDGVSRVHCSFILTGRGLWIVDLLGRGGTRVNGSRIESVRLEDGDRVRIGRFRFQVDCRSLKWRPAAGQRDDSQQSAAEFGPSVSFPPSGEELTALALSGAASQGELIARSATNPGGFSEEFVISVINEFAAMQQEMFAQTRQQMMMMAQLFDRMHESHRHLIREDLLRVQEITQELHKLRTEVLQARTAQPASPDHSSTRRAGSPKSNGAANGHHPATRKSPDMVGDSLETAQTDAPAVPNNGIPPLDDAGATPRNHRDVASHAWLAERMGLLEQERAGRWQKIMQALTRSSQAKS